jgi:hydroxyethylthiazole kinase-like uncharacterized protein yjeF
MSTRGLRSQSQWPLHTVAQTRTIEHQAQANLPAYTLMQRAGLATAQLALAIAPHAQKIWIACGPGNNGGDGLEAAVHLHTWGKQPVVTWLGQPEHCPADARHAWQCAKEAGVTFSDHTPEHFDLAIDALLGIGTQRPPEGVMAQWLETLQRTSQPVLCIDVPTGLQADTGVWLSNTAADTANTQRHTLSLLTLKPGLFTADGRDAAGHVWFNDLGVHDWQKHSSTARLQQRKPTDIQRPHSSHKGSFGDVCILGGAQGMSGAAVLAGLAALHGGAGRVLVGLLDTTERHTMCAYPTLMLTDASDLNLTNATVVCGCGGGEDIHAFMHHALSISERLVIDADGLNAIARDTSLQRLLIQRNARGKPTVLTPHPLEAARLLKCTTQDVQNNRLLAAQRLTDAFRCTVVLKGSGSSITSAHHTPVINGSGNALLATAGTGDVLAGLIGAYIAHHDDVFDATCKAVWMHGKVADTWPRSGPALDAAALAASVR